MKKYLLIIICLLMMTACSKTSSGSDDQLTIKTNKGTNPVISLKTARDYKNLQLSVSTYQKGKWQDQSYTFPVKNKACRLTLKLNSGVIVYQSDVLYRSRKFAKANYTQWAFIKDGTYSAAKKYNVAGILNNEKEDIALSQGKSWHPTAKKDTYVFFSVQFEQ